MGCDLALRSCCRSSLRERIEACAELQDSPTEWAPTGDQGELEQAVVGARSSGRIGVAPRPFAHRVGSHGGGRNCVGARSASESRHVQSYKIRPQSGLLRVAAEIV
jgi:hypothetical protein